MNIQEIRQKFPQYKDVPDEELAKAFYTKYYADKMSEAEFNAQIGLSKAPVRQFELTNPTAPSIGAYAADRLKSGLGSGIENFGLLGSILTGTAGEQSKQEAAEARRKAQEAMGFKNYRAEDEMTQAFGAGVEMTSDPTNWLLPTTAKTGGGKIVERIMGGFLPGATGKFGEQVAESVDPAYGVAGAVLGGVAGGVAQSRIANIPRTGRAVYNAVKERGPEAMAKLTASQADQHLSYLLKAAVDADPSLTAQIIRLQKIDPEMTITAIANNPVIKASIAHSASRNPEWGAKFTDMWDRALEQANKQYDAPFGARTQAPEALQEGVSRSREAQKTRITDALDARAVAASRPVAPYYSGSKPSEQIKKLVEAPEGKLSPKSTPFYDKAEEIAADTGAALSENSVSNIWKTVQAESKESPFARFPTILNKVKEKFAPVVDPDNPRVRQWNPADYSEVRSLQSEISAEYARLNPASPTYRQDRALLSQLRKSVDEGMRNDFAPELVENLKLGGQQYAYDLTLRDFSRSVFNDKGAIDPKKAKAWLLDENNNKAIHRIVSPEGQALSETIGNPSVAVAKLMERKDAVNSLYTELHKSRIFDLSKETPQAIVNKVYSDPKFVQSFLQKYGTNKGTLNALRSMALDDLVQSPMALKTLTQDKNKAQALNRLFGPTYAKQVEELALISDMMRKNPASIKFDMNAGVTQDMLEELTDIPLSQVASRMRNPIRGKVQSAIELLTKSVVARSGREFENKLQTILLDPEQLQDALRIAQAAQQGRTIDASMLKKMKDWFRDAAADSIRGGFVGANVATQNEQ